MSVTYDILCRDCKKSLWIGQSSYIYTSMPEVMKALEAFLYDHAHHNLTFEPMELWDEIPEGWEAIDANRYKEKSPPQTTYTMKDM